MPMSPRAAMRQRIAASLRAGGFLDAVKGQGAALERVRQYVESFEEAEPRRSTPLQYPDYPCFPGVRNVPFRDEPASPAVRHLESAFAKIASDYRSFAGADYMHYVPSAMERLWAVRLLWYMGICLEPFHGGSAATFDALRGLPNACLDYPWGDALFSMHASESHLKPHCSVDNLRVRCHLGVAVPPGCEIRVGRSKRTWQEGRVLQFEDSFEHEVWNRGASRRAILIVDLWHPDLTEAETRALTAGFRHSSVRGLFLRERLAMVSGGVPEALGRYLEAEMFRQDKAPEVREYWRDAGRGGIAGL